VVGLPNVELILVDSPQHNVVEALIRQGNLQGVLNRLMSKGIWRRNLNARAI
jgi:hypothetical protein